MNLVDEKPCTPIRILIINPLSDAGVMFAMKVLRGIIFGTKQMVNITVLVYENERMKGEELKYLLDGGGFPCNNGIAVTTELPSLSDADIFVVITAFDNPNCLDFNQMDDDYVFDTLYLLLKVAGNLEMPPPPPPPEDQPLRSIKRQKKPQPKPMKPIIVTDGLVAMDIIKKFSKNLPNDIFFTTTPLASVAKKILGEHLKVRLKTLNLVHVWAANDAIFHVGVSAPIYNKHISPEREHCEWDVMAYQEYEDLNLDTIHFSEGWLKKNFLERIKSVMKTCGHGSIHKAAILCSLLQRLWTTRRCDEPQPELNACFGIISDGSLGTHEGLPYILPIICTGDTYIINEYLKDDYHLKQEIKSINKAVLTHHQKLISYCKKFLKANVIGQEFLLKSESTSSHGYTNTVFGDSISAAEE